MPLDQNNNRVNLVERPPEQSDVRMLIAPEIPAALPLLADEEALTIPRGAQEAPLTVTIPEVWENHSVSGITVLEFMWDEYPVVEVELPGKFDPADYFPLSMDIPAVYMSTPGIRRLSYRITTPNQATSHPIFVNIDKEAPNGGVVNTRLIFDPEVLEGGVTEAYLLAHEEVVAEVPRWTGMRLEDRVYFYWDTFSRGQGSTRDPVDYVEVTDTTETVYVRYSAALIRSRGNGWRYARYHLQDRAGNETSSSRSEELNVDLEPTPVDLPAPEVPQAVPGPVNLEHAREGVRVQIREIADIRPGDILTIYWDGHALLPAIVIGDMPIWPAEQTVPWSTLAAGGTELPRGVRVFYQWSRGGIGPVDSRSNFVDVDFTVAGPENPEAPELVNPLLPRVVVKGVTADNKLTYADYGLDATVQVALYAGPQRGQILELFWGWPPRFADRYVVKASDTEGTIIPFTVPWAIIEDDVENPALPVFYTTFNGVNRQQSRNTLVDVNITTIKGLKPARYPDADIFQWINCANAPWNGIRVEIPGDNQRLSAGDKIELFWQGCRNSNGSDPIPGTDISLIHEELTADEAENGLIIRVLPFDPYIKAPGSERGSALVHYRVTKEDGKTGFSPRNFVRISIVVPGSSQLCVGDDEKAATFP
ncbi:hypothetical protein D3C85_670930 [compost metagenome]